MATTYTLSSHSYDGRYLKLTCSQTKNIEKNQSTINWTLTSLGGSVNYYTVGPTTVVIGGQQVYYKAATSYSTQAFPAAKGSTSGSITVNHNTDGSKSVAVSLSTAIYTGTVKTASGTWTLDSNPRKATLSSAPDFKETENPTITYSNLAGNAVNALDVGIFSADGSKSYAPYRSISKTGTSYTFNLTDSERAAMRAAMNTSTTLPIEFVIRTTIGDTKYYSILYRTITLSDSSITINTSVIDTNEAAIALTGDKTKLIKHFSIAQATMNVYTSFGATVSTSSIKNGSKKVVNALTATFNPVEDKTFHFSITDSRGTVETDTHTLTTIDYIPLTANLKTQPMDTDGNLSFEASGNYFSGSFGTTNNTLKVQIRYKTVGGTYSGWYNISSVSTSGSTYRVAARLTGLNYRENYIVQVRATDLIYTSGVYSAEKEVRSIPVFDWGEDDFKFNVPVVIDGNLTVNGSLSVGGDYIIEQGTSGNWTYRKWNSGTYECWTRLAVNTTVNSTWGSLYVSGSLSATNLTFPITFTAIPVVNVNLSGSGSGAFLIASGSASASTTKTGIYEIARGSASTSSVGYAINYYVVGKWK